MCVGSRLDARTYDVRCGSERAMYDQGACADSRVVNGNRDVVLLRATTAIAGVRRCGFYDVDGTGHGRARDDTVQESRGCGKNSDWIVSRSSALKENVSRSACVRCLLALEVRGRRSTGASLPRWCLTNVQSRLRG